MKKHEIYLPLKYNDGRRIEAEKIKQIREELIAVFGALTVSTARTKSFCNDNEALGFSPFCIPSYPLAVAKALLLTVASRLKPSYRLLPLARRALREQRFCSTPTGLG